MTPTGPLVWGEPGTNGQHAFFQLLHQGTDIIPVEFIAAAVGHEPDLKHHHDLLLANVVGAVGSVDERPHAGRGARPDAGQGHEARAGRQDRPHRVFSGNRPSLTILYRKLDPRTFGRLIALYEHRVFVEGTLYDINSFDQWGVELGKELGDKPASCR